MSLLTERDMPQKFLGSREIVQLLECGGNGIVTRPQFSGFGEKS